MFADDIVYAKTTHYQRIVVTRNRAGFQLFLNGNLQFSSADEYRYHEALVHPAMVLASEQGTRRAACSSSAAATASPCARCCSYPSVEHVTLVDLDPDMTALVAPLPAARATSTATRFEDPRVHVVNEDAMLWLERDVQPFDAAIVDFPDPNTFALGKLYTTRFYRLLKARLAPDAAVARAVHLAAVRARRLLVHRPHDGGRGLHGARPTTPPCRRSASGASRSRAARRSSRRRARPRGLRFLDDDLDGRHVRAPRSTSAPCPSRSTASTIRRSSATTRPSGGATNETKC